MGRTDHNIQRHCKNGKSTQHSGSVIVPIFSCRQSEGTPVSLPSGRFGIAEFVFTLAPFPISGIRRVREFLPGNFPPSLKGMYPSQLPGSIGTGLKHITLYRNIFLFCTEQDLQPVFFCEKMDLWSSVSSRP